MSSDNPVAAEKRAAAERLLERYPDLTGDELERLLHYFRKEASSLDCALVSSNYEVLGKYRQFCRDHYLNRLRPREVIFIGACVTGLVALLIAFSTFSGSSA
ncbi:hypothetical protein H0274_12450 [Altererythrobacter sp. CC-YST694]|uniref:hypothetical protein n=1 Tax=Altererythrobacter sp. CC-YST694 TaxID=2755038 RepID=UPI001D01D47E|nr:hypothetical protein [Altererythrobacter sp. CC-YST694]MCB5426071.1 hypothetical protein [Altererythrobacter sp. CC-YST694]